jgi:integrase
MFFRQSTRGRRHKPTKPNPSFPLTPHNNGQWCKKIRGKIRFFGIWEEPDAALENYLRVAADLHAGREPRPSTVSAECLTVKQLCNHYLTYQHRRSQAGEIGPRWFEDCRTVLDSFVSFTGPGRLASDLAPDDFLKYRQRLSRQGLTGRRGLGVYAMTRAITVVRSMLKYAYEMNLIDNPIKYGKTFEQPSSTLKRKSRRAAELANGKRLFDASGIRSLIGTAQGPLRTLILLGINGGFGNTDCAGLTLSAIDWDRGIIEFDRAKTGIERVVPLWPETLQALKQLLETRPKPADKNAERLLFLTGSGKAWVRQYVHYGDDRIIKKVVNVDTIGEQFRILLRKLGLKRKGVGFYALRHTFRTWADEVRDQHAIHRIMGHTIPGMSGIYIEEISLDRLRAVVNHVRSKLLGSAETAKTATAVPPDAT